MKQIRTVALSRHRAPDFALVFGLELLQLRKLSDLAFRLFVELAAMSDFTTGDVRTTYPLLIALLDHDRTPKAHATPRPTLQRIRTALAELAALNLVRSLDPKRNARQGLFFRVSARGWNRLSNGMSNTMSNTARTAGERATKRVPAVSTPDEQHNEQQRVQERITTPLPPLLSTGANGTAARQKLDGLRDQAAARVGRPLKRPPQGG